ncbi:C4-dicarboxylate ABC transporter [Francisella sp. Scap27]|uniref:TDT family transporter n=1 Tax=Francisella sp. Scap27 TaxID=2589986 RepID=UPI0015BB2996|nr:TDT family transporter [Francisella sp. Scap27]QLE79866.1 C4-dicarboxylate ABC transporter [Francisella sp. Scap27]
MNKEIELQKEMGPNWFASVMGTGIIANAAVGLPFIGKDLTGFATVIWLIAFAMLIFMTIVKGYQTITKPHIIKRQFNDPIMSQFFGAPPMAFLTVAGGTLLLGPALFGQDLALDIAWPLFWIGTISGVVTAVIIPYRLFTYNEVHEDAAFGGWLMPVVPPMVSATIGSMFLKYMENGDAQQTLLYGMYACFGLSLVASLIIITLIWSRLSHSGTSGSARVPTLWIVLGPLGQSITAAGALGTAALFTVSEPIATGMNVMAILYGVPVWGFAMLWFFIASLLTLRALKRKMPFALTWWAFTFPVGTCVTGTTQLALHTHLPFFQWAAISSFIFLIFAWSIAAIGTIKGIRTGKVLYNPTSVVHVKAKKK